MQPEASAGGPTIERAAAPRREPRPWGPLDWAALTVVTLGAAAVRLPGLARPVGLVFDEIFYAQNACRYVIGSEAICGIDQLASRAHPPLGNWIVGAGISLFGYEPFGWRIMPAVAGVLTVALLFVLARRLLAPSAAPLAATAGAFAAAGLLATDFLHLVQSRIAMLDAFVTLFVVAAVLFAVVDRDRRRDDHDPTLVERVAMGRPWRLAAGAAIGAAAATKWSGAYIGLAVVALVVVWEVAARVDERGWRNALSRAVRAELAPSVVLLGLVPAAVYLASYSGRMPGELIGLPWREETVWRGIYEHQRAMLDFHTSLAGHHPYESPPWAWIALKRPVAYFFEATGGVYREILAVGNPLVWWPALAALVALVVRWARGGFDPWAGTPVVLAGAVATYGTWLVLSGTRSQVFLWYLLPTVPFLCLALGLMVAWLWAWPWGRVVAVVYGLLVAASLVFAFPVLTALPVGPEEWRQRILFAECDRPAAPTLELPDDEINQGPPPAGWCWI